MSSVKHLPSYFGLPLSLWAWGQPHCSRHDLNMGALCASPACPASSSKALVWAAQILPCAAGRDASSPDSDVFTDLRMRVAPSGPECQAVMAQERPGRSHPASEVSGAWEETISCPRFRGSREKPPRARGQGAVTLRSHPGPPRPGPVAGRSNLLSGG